jgi:DivIVA domain-containing protein
MALTPEDVRNKQFTTVRFKEGYDLDEVDNFLDEVEVSLSAATLEAKDLRAVAKGEVPDSIREEIRALGDENIHLRNELHLVQTQVAAAQLRGDASNDGGASNEALKVSQDRINALEAEIVNLRNEGVALVTQISELSEQLATAHVGEANGIAAAVAGASTPMEQGVASVRILELAQRTADEAISAARIESDQILAVAKSNVANMTRELESQRVSMERRVEELRAYEREYRGRLRSYLEGQLRELDSKNISGDRQVSEN